MHRFRPESGRSILFGNNRVKASVNMRGFHASCVKTTHFASFPKPGHTWFSSVILEWHYLCYRYLNTGMGLIV